MEFFKTPTEKNTCSIRVLVNPGQLQKYTLTRNLNGDVNLQINIQNPDYDLDFIASLIETDLVFKTRYNVVFNWSNTPQKVRDNIRFQEKLIKLLKPAKSSKHAQHSQDLNVLAEITQLHMLNHQNYPDIKKYYLPKQMDKIHNYIRTITNQQLTREATVEIAKKILENSVSE